MAAATSRPSREPSPERPPSQSRSKLAANFGIGAQLNRLRVKPGRLAAGSGPGGSRQAMVQPLAVVEQTHEGSANRGARAQRRSQLHGEAAAAAHKTILRFLEANTVRPATHDQYHRMLLAFKTVAQRSGWKVHPNDMDQALADYIEHLYFTGAVADEGSGAVAAVEYFHTALLGQLPLTRKSLRGLRRLVPGSSRAPLPFLGLMCLVGAALSR